MEANDLLSSNPEISTVKTLQNCEKNLASNLTNVSNFHSLEVVDRVSETQFHVSENVNCNSAERVCLRFLIIFTRALEWLKM